MAKFWYQVAGSSTDMSTYNMTFMTPEQDFIWLQERNGVLQDPIPDGVILVKWGDPRHLEHKLKMPKGVAWVFA